MSTETLQGSAAVLASDQYQPTSGNGFILCVFGTDDNPVTHWRLDADAAQIDRPMEEELSWPAGRYTITFTADGGATPPPPVKNVVVRSGLGTIIIVSYAEGGKASAA